MDWIEHARWNAGSEWRGIHAIRPGSMRSYNRLNFSTMYLLHSLLFLLFIFILSSKPHTAPFSPPAHVGLLFEFSYLNILSFIIHPVTSLSNRILDFLHISLHLWFLRLRVCVPCARHPSHGSTKPSPQCKRFANWSGRSCIMYEWQM